SNDVTRLQALVDRKKVVITEATIRDALRLNDADGVDSLPNEEIFAELARNWSMSAKRTSWNEFSSAMASAVICLSTAEEIEEQGDAEEQVQDNVDDAAQGADTAVSGDDVQDQSIPSPTPPTPPPQPPQDIPSTSQEALDACAALTRRFEHLEHDKVAQDLEITKLKTRVKKLERANKVKALKLRRLKKVGTSQRIESSDDIDMEDASNQGKIIDKLDRDTGVALMVDEGTEKKVEDAQVARDEHVKGRQAEIYQINMDHALKVLSMQEDEPEVHEAVEVVTTGKLITEVVVTVSESVSAASATIAAVPAATITVVPVRVAAASTRRRRRKGVVIRDPEEESTAKTPVETKSKDKGKRIMVEEPKPMKKKQHVKMDEEYARKLHEELNLQSNKRPRRICMCREEEDNRAIESINKTPAQKVAKRRKQNEEVKDADDLKRHLEIVPDEDDDVYTEATPLARKVLVVDYRIIQEDLESLWSIVKERFSTSKPNNYSDDYLLTTLRAMFGRPYGQDQVWKSQRIERRYPLLRFTLDQMLNAIRLTVEEQSEMSLELIRFTRQQLQEGQHE
nr:hypothetical protein [Tanacetum cinerariifolium]